MTTLSVRLRILRGPGVALKRPCGHERSTTSGSCRTGTVSRAESHAPPGRRHFEATGLQKNLFLATGTARVLLTSRARRDRGVSVPRRDGGTDRRLLFVDVERTDVTDVLTKEGVNLVASLCAIRKW